MAKIKKAAKTKLPYEIKNWSGKPQYCCGLCSFDTLNEDGIFEHILNVHPVQEIQKEQDIFEIDLKEDPNG